MLLLCLDTSTSAVTVALHDGSRVLAARSTIDVRRHAELLAPSIDGVLHEAGIAPREITHVACGVGPGPFTGLRVGLSTARVFGFAVGATVLGICSLDVLAFQAYSTGAVSEALLVASDARRREVYRACYQGDSTRANGPEVSRPADLPDELRALPVTGRGPLLYPDQLRQQVGDLDVSAAALGSVAAQRLAGSGELLPPEPLYLRRPDVTMAAPKKVS